MNETSSSPAPPPISVEEHRQRIADTQARMDAVSLDALFITSEDNYRYLTGFDAPVWQNLTRPRYCVLPASGDPILILPSSNEIVAWRTTPWIKDIRSWVAPNPEDDGVSLCIDALKALAGKHGRIGAELGRESRVTMPIEDFLRVRDGVAPLEFADADWMLRTMRMVKSPAEIALMRYVCQLVSIAFETLPSYVNKGDSEREVAAKFQIEVFKHGGEKIPYLICTSGPGGYPCINLGPSDHRLEESDVLILDTGVSYQGYFCDFDRDYSVGEPSDAVKRAYDAVWRATEAGIAAAKPGNKTSDVWLAQATVLAEADGKELNRKGFGSGRLGHGIGLRMCEPPSNSPVDDQLLVENMTLTIEPGLPFFIDGENGPERKILVHEENVVITPDGGKLLTGRAPREMPIIE